MLVTIGIMATLVGILLPALGSSRDAARETVCLANLHGIGQTFATYRGEQRDRYPFAEPGASIPASPDGSGVISPSSHWDLSHWWTGVVQRVAPWREHFASWVCPGSPRVQGEAWRLQSPGTISLSGYPSYSYSNSFVARPRLWSVGGTADGALLAPTRGSEVRTPSAKALLFDSELAHATVIEGDVVSRLPVAFADGHASRRDPGDATPPGENPLRDGPPQLLHDTPSGVHGHDF